MRLFDFLKQRAELVYEQVYNKHIVQEEQVQDIQVQEKKMIANQVDVSVNDSESRKDIPTPVKELSVENREEDKEDKVE